MYISRSLLLGLIIGLCLDHGALAGPLEEKAFEDFKQVYCPDSEGNSIRDDIFDPTIYGLNEFAAVERAIEDTCKTSDFRSFRESIGRVKTECAKVRSTYKALQKKQKTQREKDALNGEIRIAKRCEVGSTRAVMNIAAAFFKASTQCGLSTEGSNSVRGVH